jgi:protein tyrosine phosphatase
MLYARAKFLDAVGYGSAITSKVKYMYWNNGWILNSDHNSSYGDVNATASIIADVDMKVVGNKDVQDINYTTTHSLPYGTVAHFAVNSWLFYNPLATTFKLPKDSKDCRTHPCARVTFLDSSKGWGGIDSTNSKYSETNRSVEVVPYKEDENVSKKEVKRINW